MIAVVWQATGTCPIVKRIWTPSFALYSAGWVLLLLSGFHAMLEWKEWRRWAFPLIVIGMNSIAIYVASWTMEGFLVDALNRHIGKSVFSIGGRGIRAGLPGGTGASNFLVRSALDVQTEDFPSNLSRTPDDPVRAFVS